MDSALHELLSSEVVHQARVAADAYDAPVFGPPRLLRARIVEEGRELRVRASAAGDSRVVVTRGYLIVGEDAAPIAPRDRIGLPTIGDVVDVVAVSAPRDLDGTVHHVRVEFL